MKNDNFLSDLDIQRNKLTERPTNFILFYGNELIMYLSEMVFPTILIYIHIQWRTKKTASPVKKQKSVQKVCFMHMYGMNMMLLQWNEEVGFM